MCLGVRDYNWFMINIASFNVNGLRNFVKRKKIYYHLREILQLDIICMQETHCLEKDLNLWRSQWGSEMYNSYGESNARGVTILIKRNFVHKVNECIIDPRGRYIIMELIIEQKPVVLASLYAPNRDEPLFFEEFFTR